FLRDLHSLVLTLAILESAAAGIAIDRVFGVDEVAPMLDQPFDPVIVAALLVGGKREDQVAIGPVILLFKADEVGQQQRIVRLHIGRAASIEPAIGFPELKRIERPIFAAGID